ncbi:MAG: hypothetical protein IKR18_01735 [Bacteroidaceae bacterium]|nr:hypothetical protein [Bacteroidaceae bacterium]
MFTACTDVETIESTQLSSANKWNVTYKWDSPAGGAPDSMLIIANRAINTYRYIYNWNVAKAKSMKLCESTDLGYKKTQLTVDSTLYNPTDTLETEQQKIENGQAAADNSNDDILVRPGQYTAITASLGKDIIYTCLNTEGFQQFMDSTVSVREVAMYYKTLTTDSIYSRFGRRWTDFNPTELFICDVGHIYFDEQKQITVKDGEATNIQFSPRDITQNLTVRFKVILRGGNIQVNDLLGSISGIPGSVRLSSLYINTGPTRKMAFRPEVSVKNDTTLEYTAQMVVPGLLADLDTTRLNGPGVLQLGIFTQTVANDGRTVAKTFYVGRNVAAEIKEGNANILGDDNLHLVANEKEILIDVKIPIIIDREIILSLPDGESTLNKWTVDDEFTQDEDIEI